MKKIFFSIILVSFFAFSAQTTKAQSFEQGNNIVSIGYGFPNIFKSVYSIYEIYGGYESSGIGPLNAKYEYAVTDQIGVGAIVSFLTYKVAYDYSGSGSTIYQEGYKGSLFALMLRGNYHFATGDKLDPYVGVGAGYINYGFEYFNDDPDFDDTGFIGLDFGAPLAFGGSVGARYYFTDMIAAYAEIGWDALSLMQIGVSAKF